MVAGLAALALAASALGPCRCLADADACHREAAESDAHSCCEKPTGVQVVADECCEASPGIVAASTEVPEVAPPSLRTSAIAGPLPIERSAPAATVRTPPPLSLDRTAVLLI
jgi:hypothetical protein